MPWSTAWRRARHARTRGPSASSTSGRSTAWPANWSSRPTSSRRWPPARTSSRASSRSCKSGRLRSRAREAATGRSMNTIPAALRRKPLLKTLLALSALVALAFASPASAGLLDPEHGGSPNADRIDTLYWIIFAIGLVIWLIVEGSLLYSLFKFRARRGAVPAQIRGNTRLEVGWTVGAAVILVILAVVTFAMLGKIRNPDNSGAAGLKLANGTLLAASPIKKLPPNGKSLNICVNGQQYVWRYTYSDNCSHNDFTAPFAYERMVVPVDTTVTLDI